MVVGGLLSATRPITVTLDPVDRAGPTVVTLSGSELGGRRDRIYRVWHWRDRPLAATCDTCAASAIAWFCAMHLTLVEWKSRPAIRTRAKSKNQ